MEIRRLDTGPLDVSPVAAGTLLTPDGAERAAWQIAEEMKNQNLTKTELAKRMHTSRAALNRLLDETDPSLTLTTLASAASALGKKVNIELAAAS